MIKNIFTKSISLVIASSILSGCAIYGNNYSCEHFKDEGTACQKATTTLIKDEKNITNNIDPKTIDQQTIKDLKEIKEQLAKSEDYNKKTEEKIKRIEEIIKNYESQQREYLIKQADKVSTMKIYIDKNTMEPTITQPRILKVTLLPYTDTKTNKYISVRTNYIIVKQPEFVEVDNLPKTDTITVKDNQSKQSLNPEEKKQYDEIQKIINNKILQSLTQQYKSDNNTDNKTIMTNMPDNNTLTITPDTSKTVKEKFAKVIKPKINVREKPSSNSKIIAVFSKNSILKLCDTETDGWVCIVLADNRNGYVSKKLITTIEK